MVCACVLKHVCARVIAGLTTGGRLLQHFRGTVFIRAAASVDVGYQRHLSVVLSFDAFLLNQPEC